MNEINRPKIGLALSGASGRAITHIGVLEVFRENNISLDCITACSSGTFIAASYACGTMEELKYDWMKFNKRFVLSVMGTPSGAGGIFRTEKMAKWLSKYTKGKKFEDVRPRLGFVSADIRTGEIVLLTLGDLVKAGQASSAVPGLFQPVEWGNKLLVDGGLFSIVPTTQAKQMGADIVIGVDIASSPYMFDTSYLNMRRGYNFLRRSWPVKLYLKLHQLIDWAFSKSINFLYYNRPDVFEESSLPAPGFFSILGKALDISVEQSDTKKGLFFDYDLMISPNVKHHGKADFVSAAEMLEEGRRAARAAMPEIKKLIMNWQQKAK